ncbi:hypothetical protein LWC34_44210 [Kibdelosporangium philippinense]|uniref:Exo-alpha-sialidase n=1 Tax=Kibdelosporangium philippinense TaxID=211113 RepID=A0ABS8ZPT7_9PSEU|nr:hypothetical protein [Kibdelosporangium philippinense]MCE7009769.1 hypothetical protein [Kibdelosporangium philippinense]
MTESDWFATLYRGAYQELVLAVFALTRDRAQPVPAADGSWWVSVRDPATYRMSLATIRDGRTWTVSQLLKDPANEVGFIREVTVVSSNGVLYALGHSSVSTLGAPSAAFFSFYRSMDGGHSWELTYDAGVPRVVHSVSPTPVVISAGDIIVSTPDAPQRVLVSKDGGRSFQPAMRPELDWVSWTRAGYLNTRTGPTPTHWLSEDGINWRKLGE